MRKVVELGEGEKRRLSSVIYHEKKMSGPTKDLSGKYCWGKFSLSRRKKTMLQVVLEEIEATAFPRKL